MKSPKKSMIDGIIFQVSSQFDLPKTKQTLAILRFIFFDDKSNLVKVKEKTQVRYLYNGKKKFTRKQIEAPVSVNNELRVLKELTRMCYSRLHNYPSTLKSDLGLLKTGNLTKNQRNALTVTIEEKRELQDLIRKTDIIIDLLLMDKKEAKEKAAEIKVSDEDLKEYMKLLLYIL